MQKIILLDLNYTLVENSSKTFDFRRGPDVAKETYRRWLVDAIRDCYVILITARTEEYREETMRSIAAKLDGWQPQEAYFKPERHRYQRAAWHKRRIMQEYVLPKRGRDSGLYLALESNSETRAMYSELGIAAYRAEEQEVWKPLLTPFAGDGVDSHWQMSLL